MRTEVVRASELFQKVVGSIYDARYPGKRAEILAEIKRYEKLLSSRGREEITRTVSNGLVGHEETGFVSKHLGQEIFVKRPTMPAPVVWQWIPYEEGYWKAHEAGLLASSLFNRPIRQDRVEHYKAEMQAGRWRNLLSDPIALTDDGQVVNGQHRLIAAWEVDWEKVENDPLFLVVRGVSPTEAQFADGSRRTEKDGSVIKDKLLAAMAAADGEGEQ